MTHAAPTGLQAVIFDLDGTLLDSEAASLRAGLRAFEAVGVTVPDSFLHGLVGKDYSAGQALIRARFPEIDSDRLAREWAGLTREMRNRDGVALKPGAAELLAHLSERGMPLALATSSHDGSAREKLALSGLDRHFDIVVTRDSVLRAKPAPDAYLLAAERLSLPTDRCLVFEDSDPGAEAAHGAGAWVVQVPDILPTDGAFAHHVATTLSDGADWAGLWQR